MRKGLLAIMGLLALLLMGAGLFVFAEDHTARDEVFAKGSLINGVDVSGMSVEEAEEALTASRNAQVLTITENGVETGIVSDVALTYDIRDQLQFLLRGDLIRSPLPDFLPGNAGREKDVTMKVVEVPEETRAKIAALPMLERKYTVETKDAYVDMSDFDFDIVPEVQGDNIDKERFVDKVISLRETGRDTLEFVPSDYYAKPKVLKDDPELAKRQEYCKKYLSQKIVLTCPTGEVTIMPEDLDKMKSADDKGNITVDQGAVEEYVDAFSRAHNTLGGTWNFKTATGSKITLSGGNFGYYLDFEEECATLTENLKSGEDVTRKPVWAVVPWSEGTGIDGNIGNSYVEVDVANQMVYLFANGKKITSCPTVTGNMSNGEGTPAGVFRIAYMDRDATLRGLNNDGTRYASPVKYWMPFNGDVGLHDAPWRKGLFGGDYYLNDGSHGCVNLPESAAATIFNNVDAGYPVVVHY